MKPRTFADPKAQAAYDTYFREGWMRGDIERFYRQGFINVSRPEPGTPRGAVWWAGRDRAVAGLPSLIPARDFGATVAAEQVGMEASQKP